MKLLTWNIMHGGGPERLCWIALALLDWAPDVIALTEFRARRGGGLRAVLADHGWAHQARSDADPNENSVLIASRQPITSTDRHPGLGCAHRKRLLTARLDCGTSITAAHIPDARRSDSGAMVDKATVWHEVLRVAETRRNAPHIVMGDLNTGRHRLDEAGSTFSCTALLGRLASMGYTDAWRAVHGGARAASWFSHTGAGFRLDHALVSGPIAGCIRSAEYGAAALESGLSDHAPLLLEVA